MKLIYNISNLIQVRPSEANIQQVPGNQMDNLPILESAWLAIEDDRILDYGPKATQPKIKSDDIDAKEGCVLPTWCDSHTHLVFAASRESEFVDKIHGISYAEIAAKGGGILNSAKRLQEMSEDTLFQLSLERLKKVIALGTGAIEIKSGYGLTLSSELKMLSVIKRLKELQLIPIKATFLGAHAFPEAYKDNKSKYVDMVINDMLPEVAKEGLADYIDVFCEEGFFSVEDTDKILKAGMRMGMKSKIHANQLHNSGGVQIGVANNALSVDHLESIGTEEINCLQNSQTIPTLLPGAAFFLNMSYPPARQLINANLPVTVASDFNPGSCPSGNMNVMLSLSCIQMKMTPNEAINAQTINGAAAMELSHIVGSITKGKLANLIITKPIPSIAYLPYAYGDNLIAQVIINGQVFNP